MNNDQKRSLEQQWQRKLDELHQEHRKALTKQQHDFDTSVEAARQRHQQQHDIVVKDLTNRHQTQSHEFERKLASLHRELNQHQTNLNDITGQLTESRADVMKLTSQIETERQRHIAEKIEQLQQERTQHETTMRDILDRLNAESMLFKQETTHERTKLESIIDALRTDYHALEQR